MIFKKIKTENQNNIGIIVLNMPEILNLIEEDTFDEIAYALNIFEKNKNIKIILIKSNCGMSKTGKKIFSAGVNLKEYYKKFEIFDKNPIEFENFLRNQRKLMTKIENYSKLVIIAINGMVIGGFFELALSCDLILASENASFKLNEVNIGIIPGYGGIYRLLRIVGKNKAFEIIASGKEITSTEALNLNIVSEIFQDSDFDEKIIEYCENLAEKSPNALYLIKNTINKIINSNQAEETEIENFLKAFQSEDSREGVKAFLEKRKPVFK